MLVHAQRQHEEADQSDRKREEPSGKAQAAGVPPEKEGSQYQGDLQRAWHAILHCARLAGADAEARTEGPVQQEAQGQEVQAVRIHLQDSQKVAEQEAEGVWIRVRLLAAQPDTRDDQEGV